MGDANLVQRIGCCLIGGTAAALTIAACAIGYLGLRYATLNSTLPFHKGDTAIVQSLNYSPYESPDAPINRNYVFFGSPTACVVDDIVIDAFNSRQNFRLACPGQSNPESSIYGWSVPSEMSSP